MQRALVRHGSTDWSGVRMCGRTDRPLSVHGEREARAAAGHVGSPRWTAVISSPARRARQTATAIADRCGILVEIDDRLGEVDFGQAEGYTFDDLAARWPELAAAVLRGDAVDWPEGETAVAFEARVRSVWDDLATDARDVVVVTHGGTLRVWLERLGCPGDPIAPGTVIGLVDGPDWRVTTIWAPDR